MDAKEETTTLATSYDEMWTKIVYKPWEDNYSKVTKGIFGDFFEDFVIDFIKKHTAKNNNVEVIKGFILKDNKASPQIDIIICEKDSCVFQSPTKYYGVVEYQNVKLAIEVKSWIDKPTFENAKKQISRMKEYGYSPKTCLFSHHVILNYKKQYKINNIGDLMKPFTDYFVILEGYEKMKTIYDYGDGMGELVKYLESL